MIKYHFNIRKPLQNLELARDRLHLLIGKDKVILTSYLDGQSLRQIARLSCISKPALLRKLRKLIAALTGKPADLYLLALHNRSQFTAKELYIARDRLILGLSLRQIAKKRKITYYHCYHKVCKIERRIEKCKLMLSQRTFTQIPQSKSAKKPPVQADCLA